MSDFLLGIVFAGLAVKGWLRSFTAELYELAAVIAGIAISFRLSAPIGDAIATRFGSTPEAARILTGVGMLMLVTAGLLTLERTLVAGRRIDKGLRARMAGMVTSVVTGVVVIVLVVSVVRAIPGESALQRVLERSALVGVVVPGRGAAESLLTTVAGDPVMDALLAIQPEFGSARVVVVDDPIEFEPQSADDLEVRADVASEIGDMVSEARVAAGADPAAWSEGLAGVAAAYALDLYRSGLLAHQTADSGTLDQRVASAAITLLEVDETVAMASSAVAAHKAIQDEPAAAAVMDDPSFDRFGIGVVDGPLGLLVVEVFGR